MATKLPEFENQAEARILFVDSDEQGCAMVIQMLNLVGSQVHQATSGEQALAQLELINYGRNEAPILTSPIPTQKNSFHTCNWLDLLETTKSIPWN